jgi:hypothetical protein
VFARDRFWPVSSNLVGCNAAGLTHAPYPVNRGADAYSELLRGLYCMTCRRSLPPLPRVREGPWNKACPSMLAFPASMVNQRSTDLGIPNRFRLRIIPL